MARDDDDDDDLTIRGREASVTVESATTKDESPEAKAERQRKERLLKRLRKHIRSGVDAWDHFRKNAKKDAQFRAGTWGERSFQWIESIYNERQEDQRRIERQPASDNGRRNEMPLHRCNDDQSERRDHGLAKRSKRHESDAEQYQHHGRWSDIRHVIQ